ncbi:oligosaccharide flippase family protein [Nautilia lithotrophica]
MFKKIFRHGSAYLIVSLLTKATGFLLLPIITKYLNLSEYGLYTNLQSTQNILYLIATLGLDSAYGRFVYDYNSSIKKLRLLTSTIITFFIFWSIIYLIISIIGVYYLIESWGYKELLISILLPFIVLFQQFSALNVFLMQSKYQTKKILTITTFNFFAVQLILLILLIYFHMGVKAFFVSQFLVGFITLLIHINIMRKENVIKIFLFNKNTFKKTFGYALGYVPLSFSSWIFNLSDRYIITYYVSLAMAGKYSFIIQLTSILQFITQSIDTAFTPTFMKLMKENTQKNSKSIEAFFIVFIYLLLLVYLTMVFFLPFIIQNLFPLKYHGDYFLISIIGMGFVFLSIRKIFANILVYYKKSWWMSMSGYLPALLNLVLNFIFIPKYGIYAAAWTTLFSFFIYAVIVFAMAQKLKKFILPYEKFLFLFLVSIIFSYVSLKYNKITLDFLMLLIFLFIGKMFNIDKLLRI